MDIDNERIVTDVQLPENSSSYSITALLNYCKSKLLNPYLRLLSLLSLRPLINTREFCTCVEVLNYAYVVHVALFMITGYVLQYMTCFRRDRGFSYVVQNSGLLSSAHEIEARLSQEKICYGSTIFSFILPNVLHFIAYIHAIFTFRSSDEDQLPVLTERVFLVSSNLSNSFQVQKRLVRVLWVFICIGIVWMIVSLVSVNFMLLDGNIDFKWISKENNETNILHQIFKVLLIISVFWHDSIKAIIIANYCLQAQLLTTYLHFLKEKLLQYSTEPLEWMRETEHFKKLLNYLNKDVSPSTSIFTLVNMSYAISGVLWYFNLDLIDRKTVHISRMDIVNIVLWILISIVPFIQAARLSSACKLLRNAGQEARIRPFVHIGTPKSELDSLLIYASSLKLSAKLFSITIDQKYLCFLLTVCLLSILVLGQCHYLT